MGHFPISFLLIDLTPYPCHCWESPSPALSLPLSRSSRRWSSKGEGRHSKDSFIWTNHDFSSSSPLPALNFQQKNLPHSLTSPEKFNHRSQQEQRSGFWGGWLGFLAGWLFFGRGRSRGGAVGLGFCCWIVCLLCLVFPPPHPPNIITPNCFLF